MRDERARRRASINRLHHRRFDFYKSMRFQLPAQRRDDLRARLKNLLRFGIRDQVEIALAIAQLDIFQTVEFFGQREQDFREECQLLGVNAQFSRARAKQIAFDADDVAGIENFVQLVFRLRNRILADVDLQLFARLHQVQKTGFAHAAHGLDASGDAHLRPVRQLLRCFGGKIAQNLRDRVRKIETLAVGAEAQRLNLRRSVQALVV